MRVALDVFAPALSRAVGQDIAALAPLAEFTKGMLYLGTHGPAGLPFELCRLARWLEHGGVAAPGRRLAEVLGLPLPHMDALCRGSLETGVFELQLDALRRLAGPSAAAGIDAGVIEDLAVLDDEALDSAVQAAAAARVPIVLSWDLMTIPAERLTRIGRITRSAA